MPLLTVIVVLLAVGILVTALQKYGGMLIAEPYLTWICWLIVIATAIWLLGIIGVFDYFRAVPMPTLHGR
jgi:hypothetical protein